METINSIEEYTDTLTSLLLNKESQSNLEESIDQLIDQHLANCKNDPDQSSFLQGEKAFFSKQYKLALMHYLAAKELPNYQFYCYRASAYLSHQLKQYNKAQLFIEKALALNPDDPMTQRVLEEIKAHLEQEEEQGEPSSREEPIALDEQEIDQLSAIFEEQQLADKPASLTTFEEIEESLSRINQTQTSSNRTEIEMETVEELEKKETTSSTAAVEAPRANAAVEDDALSYIPIDELNKIASSTPYTVEEDTTSSYINNDLGMANDATETLDSKIRHYQTKQAEKMTSYLEKAQRRTEQDESSLLLLQGWDEATTSEKNDPTSIVNDQKNKRSDGFFLRWNEKGVAVNPGKNFLKNLHKNGYYITDIDFVVVTRPDGRSSADVKALYDLNYKLNCHSTDLHIINYYLNPKTYQEIAASLKPNFKQERKTVHCLELYVDSPDVEKIDLSSEITLRYFPTTSDAEAETFNGKSSSGASKSCIGACLDLKHPQNHSSLTQIGYVSGAAWSPILAQHIGQCDVLITGLENTNPDDYNKLKYNEDNLGYFGVCSLMEEIAPQIVICTEFDGREGDIRLEVVRKIRQEYSNDKRCSSVVIPGDTGMRLNLKTLQFRCAVTGSAVDPQNVTVIKTSEAFGKLLCVSPNSCL